MVPGQWSRPANGPGQWSRPANGLGSQWSRPANGGGPGQPMVQACQWSRPTSGPGLPVVQACQWSRPASGVPVVYARGCHGEVRVYPVVYARGYHGGACVYVHPCRASQWSEQCRKCAHQARMAFVVNNGLQTPPRGLYLFQNYQEKSLILRQNPSSVAIALAQSPRFQPILMIFRHFDRFCQNSQTNAF